MIDEPTIIEITIPGRPRQQDRPRVAPQGGFVYKSRKQKQKEAEFVDLVCDALGGRPREVIPAGVPIEITVVSRFEIPKSRRKDLRTGDPHTQKPDADNLTKFVKDCLNGLIWHDDAQVYAEFATKLWTENDPDTIVTIRPRYDMAAKGI